MTTETQTPLEWQPLWDAMKAKPDAWIPTTENMYNEMLNVLPPRAWTGGAFLVGEAYTHNAEGYPVYACFKQVGNEYEARHMTLREFNLLKSVRG